MALVKFKDLCIDVTSPAVMGPWWAERLGLRLETSATGSVLRGPTPQHTVWLNVVPETKHVKNRVHLDLQTSDDLVFASSPVLSDPELFPWVVHADPEGGEFCVFTYDDPTPTGLKDVVVDAGDAAAQAEWWAAMWGGDWDEDEGDAWIDDVPGAPFTSFDFTWVPEEKSVKNRIHWDVDLLPGVTIADLEAHGATVLRAPGDDRRWTVMADPEGNEFCVFGPES